MQVFQYLHSKNWDTRVAAAHAIGAISQCVKHTSLTELFAWVEKKMSEAGISAVGEDLVTLSYFHSKHAISSLQRCFCIFHFSLRLHGLYFWYLYTIIWVSLAALLDHKYYCLFAYLYIFFFELQQLWYQQGAWVWCFIGIWGTGIYVLYFDK